MTKISLKVQKRDTLGKKVKNMKDLGLVPGNIFGNKVDSLSVSAKLSDFQSVSEKAGETQIVYLQVEGEDKERPVLLTNIQYHPIFDYIRHIDFHQVNLKEKVTANIPVELIGESPAVKELQAVVVPSISEIEVEALPTDLPEKIEVDISKLIAIGDSIKVSDLIIDRTKIEVKTDPDTLVVTTAAQQEEEVVVAPAAEAPVEGAVPAVGATPAEATAPAKVEEKKS